MSKSGTVLVGGCFDLIHFGHIAFLRKAKSLGTTLIVALESDENVSRMKGPHRPIHTQRQRKQMLESITYVDKVIALTPLKTDAEYAQLVSRVDPDIIAVTDGDPIIDKKQIQANIIGARLVVIPKIRTPSSSQLAKLLGLE